MLTGQGVWIVNYYRWYVALLIGTGSISSGFCTDAIELDLNSPSSALLIDSPEGYAPAIYTFEHLPDGGNGIAILLRPGEGFRLYGPAIETGPGVVQVQCLLRTTNPGVVMAVAGLDVPLGGTLADMDGGVAANIPSSGESFLDRWRNLELFHNPIGDTIAPVFQTINPTSDDVTVYLDRITVIPLRDAGDAEMRERLHFYEPAAIPVPTPTLSTPEEGALTFHVYPKSLEGHCVLIQGNRLQFAFLGTPPPPAERLEPYVAAINGVDWSAEWEELAVTSSVFLSSNPLLPQSDGYEYEMEASRVYSNGTSRALHADLQVPTASNGYLAIITFDANQLVAYEFTVRWRRGTGEEPEMTPTPYPTAAPTPPIFPEDRVTTVPFRRFGLGEVEWATCSADGRFAATGGLAGSYIWDAAAGERLHDLFDFRSSTSDGEFTPDGNYLVTIGDDQAVRVWDTHSGERVHTFDEHGSWINSVSVSPDGNRVLSSSRDKRILLWEIGTGSVLRAYENADDWMTATFSPDGKTFLANGKNGVAMSRDLATGDILHIYKWRGNRLRGQPCFSPDGTKILTMGSGYLTGRAWEIWSAESGEVLTVAEEVDHRQGHTELVRFSPDGTAVLATYFNRVDFWNVEDAEFINSYLVDTRIVGAAFTSGSHHALVASQDYNSDRAVHAVDIETLETAAIFTGHSPRVRTLSVSPDEKRIATAHFDAVWIWDIEDDAEPLHKFPRDQWEGEGPVDTIAYSPDGSKIAVGSKFWIERQEDPSSFLEEFYKDSNDGIARVLDAETGELLQEYEGHEDGVASVEFFSDGTQLMTGSIDATVKFWDVETGEVLRTYTGSYGQIDLAALSPDESQILTGGWRNDTQLFDAVTGEELFLFSNDDHSLAFSSDGSKILIGSEGYVTEWSAESGESLRILEYPLNSRGWSQNDFIGTVTYSPDGTQIAHSLVHSTVLWDSETGEFQQALLDSGFPTAIVYLSDGESIVTGCYDGTVSLWRVGETAATE